MENRLLSALGKTAGLGGIALGVFLLLFQGVLQKQFLPQAGLNSAQAFAVILALMILTFGIAAIGVFAWLVSRSTNPKAPISTPTLVVLAALIALVLGAAVYAGAQARPGGSPGATVLRNAFSQRQSIKMLPPSLDGNTTLNLDNVATLRVGLSLTNRSNVITLFVDTPAISFPAKRTPTMSIEGAELSYNIGKEYGFDMGKNQRQEVVVGGRTFIVTLLEIKKLDTPGVAAPIEYVFGITDK